MAGTKYHRGESFEFAQGATGLTGVVHYSGLIAQTSDAIPFVALVGLGLVAIAAFAVARKQYNR